MATSESDDFESADEELAHDTSAHRKGQTRQWSSPTTIGSESDDDTEYVPRIPCSKSAYVQKPDRFPLARRTAVRTGEKTPAKGTAVLRDDKNDGSTDGSKQEKKQLVASSKKSVNTEEESLQKTESCKVESDSSQGPKSDTEQHKEEPSVGSTKLLPKKDVDNKIPLESKAQAKGQQTRRSKEVIKKSQLSMKQKSMFSNVDDLDEANMPEEMKSDKKFKEAFKPMTCQKSSVPVMDDLDEANMPEEMKSDKKFKETFRSEGWERLEDDLDLPKELTSGSWAPKSLTNAANAGVFHVIESNISEEMKSDKKFKEAFTSDGWEGVDEDLNLPEEPDSGASWGGWGNWGVSSLINTATAGVSTLTSHVSHGLTLLEESIGVPDPSELAKEKQEQCASNNAEESVSGDKPQTSEESKSYTGFGFGNLMSGVTSITKLVETTGSKVMSGGLDTLEAIGKKTMEVLQDGDPGLKKKRAFFLNEGDKPNLSQVLREAKEKAESAEKTFEEKQKARRVHFESLFDDYQGLVHLEALEMLSKQSNIRIQQHLSNLDGDELVSIQETLEEVKELCDLGDEEETDLDTAKNLKVKLQDACSDLGITICYTEKLYAVWEESQTYLTPPVKLTDQEIYEYAIAALAQFTAFSVERFHKTAELLLIKERRSTVNETDALVQLTNILSNQIGVLANCFCDTLNELAKNSEKPESINAHITTIFMEATNASTYIQDAFRLLIPIVQVGAL